MPCFYVQALINIIYGNVLDIKISVYDQLREDKVWIEVMKLCIITHFEKTTVLRAFLGLASLANTMPAMQAWSTESKPLEKSVNLTCKLNDTTPFSTDKLKL